MSKIFQKQIGQNFWRRFSKFFFEKHLFATNVLSSGILMGFGDIIQQEIEYYNGIRKVRMDYGRLGRMFTVGIIEGPLHHYYYIHLDRLFPGSDMKTVSIKIILDQIIASPLFIGTFFYGMGALEGKTFTQCTDELRKCIWQVYLADWLVWPPTQFINFYYVPGPYRVFYINFVTMLYNVFLSYMKHKDHKKEIKAKTEEEQEEILIKRTKPYLAMEKIGFKKKADDAD